MEDFEEFEDDEFDDEFDDEELDEFSPEMIAELKRRMQDANDGFTYEMVMLDGERAFKCNKCGRTAPIHDRPFPHKLNCPMRKRFGDS